MADSVPTEAAGEQDWWDDLHMQALLSLTAADFKIERREMVWVKRFFTTRGKDDYYHRFKAILDERKTDAFDPGAFDLLATIARERMSKAQKRDFINNLAQMCKSKGNIAPEEYESILDIAERIGMEDTDADSIIHSVFGINETLTAVVGLLALGFILYVMKVVLVPLVISIFVAMVINRVDNVVAGTLRLQRARWASKLAAMVLLFGAGFLLLMVVVESASEISARLPWYQERLAVLFADGLATAKRLGIQMPSDAVITDQLGKIPIGSTLSNVIGSAFNFLGNFLLVAVFAGFLVFSSGRFAGTGQEMTERFTAYISVKTMMSVLTALLALILCWSFGIDFAIFWATLILLLNYIPAVGAIIATIPPVLLAAIQLDTWTGVFVFAGLFILMHVVIGQVVEPKLMGDKLAVNPIAILLGLIFWGFLWGIPGMFLAAPLMALLRVYSSHYNFSRPLERLLAA